jgi:hypothetical protein
MGDGRGRKRFIMSIICWTVFHPGGPSVSQGVTRLAHAAGRRIRPIVHQASVMQHQAAKVTSQPHGWFNLVCKVVPAGLVGGGALLAPPSAIPTYLPAAPPAIVAQGPPVSPGSPMTGNFRPQTRVPLSPYVASWPPTQTPPSPYVASWPPTISLGGPPIAAPEPSSAAVLLGGVAGLLLIRLSMRGLAYSSERIQPTASQTKLFWSRPVA